jgi:hypothetical protein
MACSATKRPLEHAPLAELYDGPTWRTLRATGVPADVDVYALSAEYGLVPAWQERANYDRRMDAARAAELNLSVLSSLLYIGRTRGPYREALVVAGKDYMPALYGPEGDLRHVPATVVEVAKGGIGYKRQALRRWLLEEVV